MINNETVTLGFSQEINGEPTYFIEKIWHSLYQLRFGDQEYSKYSFAYNQQFAKDFDFKSEMQPKIHTIRKDENNRWQAGNDIHFVIGNRTKSRFQFAPITEVKSIQHFQISWDGDSFSIMIDHELIGNGDVLRNVRGEPLMWRFEPVNGSFDFREFTENDGFDIPSQFLKWFDQDFEGKIIHWTHKVY